MNPLTIQFSDLEMRLIRAWAKERQANNRTAGVFNARGGNQSDDATDTIGCIGEMVLFKAHDQYPKLTIDPTSTARGSDENDFKLGDGRIVEVKATTYNNGELRVDPKKESTPMDLAALVTATDDPNKFALRGYIVREELFKPERLCVPKGCRKPMYVVAQSELLPLELLAKPTKE